MFKIVHLVTGVAALLLSLIPSLKTDATPFLQQPDAVYLALLGLLNLVLAPVVPLYHRGARQQLQHLACALLVVAVVLQTLTLLARPEMGNLAAWCVRRWPWPCIWPWALPAARARRAAVNTWHKMPATVIPAPSNGSTHRKALVLSPETRVMTFSCTFGPSAARATAFWSKASAWSFR